MVPQRAFSSLSVENSKGFAWLSWPADTDCRCTKGNDSKRIVVYLIEESR